MSTKHRSVWSYFLLPALAFVVAVGLAGLSGGAALAATVAVLAVLEVSLSFDNAVVNAQVLQNWDAVAQAVPRARHHRRGVRHAFAFPILIVSVAGHIRRARRARSGAAPRGLYAAKLTSVHAEVSAFGGAFLAMLGLGYFFDAEKDNHWIGPIESLLAKCGQVEAIQAALTVLALISASCSCPKRPACRLPDRRPHRHRHLCGDAGDRHDHLRRRRREQDHPAGIGGFLYLEVLDASFSFDGVLGAFALTTNIIWIAVGLGVGALAVRELTMLAVDRGTLAEFPHLEMGAFWAILALARACRAPSSSAPPS
jgi:hypothetical protein